MKKYKMSWKEFDERCRVLAKQIRKHKEIVNIYGIPRGGLPIAVRLSHLTGLPLAKKLNLIKTAVVDDCKDSGATYEIFKKYKHFYVLIDKQEEGITDWIEFPFEAK